MQTTSISTSLLNQLAQSLDGTLYFDDLLKTIYSTDASVYQVLPLAVAFPKNENDLKKLIRFARKNKTSLIPRTAGTSLAGQCVGEGIVVDVSKHFTQILEFNAEEKWVRVQPGVVRDELNAFLKPHGLFFSPITSTANRAMIGGMVGNNSCGTTSIVYGSTRDHVLELKTILSDGSDAAFAEMAAEDFQRKLSLQNLEGQIYRQINEDLQKEKLATKIRSEFPKPTIHRRNTGYAVDYLLNQKPFSPEGGKFNFCKLLAGSEGTLAFTTEIKLNLDPLPAPFEIVVAAHFSTIHDCMAATQFAMKYQPTACELMDKTILDCTKDNIEQSKNRDFVVDDPAGILLVEFRGNTAKEAEAKADEMIEGFRNLTNPTTSSGASRLRSKYRDASVTQPQQSKNNPDRRTSSEAEKHGFGASEPLPSILGSARTSRSDDARTSRSIKMTAPYATPKIYPPKTKGVWSLRSAGLGLLSNIPGDKKAVTCIEDTAVALEDLADYIDDFEKMMEKFGQESVYYAHAGAGEIHLRPILDLKKSADVEEFYKISEASAKLVKKYGGSLSGEHGDGRVRAAFIPLMVGEEVYDFFKKVKNTWDEANIFNPGKIVDAPPMNEALRYEPDQPIAELETIFDFSETGGILRTAEKCNGSGDCRKLPLSGGTMCPSYQATRNEKDTTRARANTLRNFLTKSSKELSGKQNPFDHEEIKEVMDLCISCKGCSSECPSNVDMSTMKAEFLHQYYKTNGVPLRAKAFANINSLNALGAIAPGLTNWFLTNKLTGGLLKKILKVAPARSLPKLEKTTLHKWFFKNHKSLNTNTSKPIYFFCDEFTNFNDTKIGISAIQLLTKLGYEVRMPQHAESGRAAISKGLLLKAKGLANENVRVFKDLVSKEVPLIGIEPSAILSFRDEYPRLVDSVLRETAKKLSKNVLTIEEFLAREMEAGRISPDLFHDDSKKVLLHGHCHQKALSSVDPTAWILSLPRNYEVEIIPSGCCGMAGSFGYEAEHFDVSMQIGELVLFPAVRATEKETVVVAPGTSCRHQIADGTGRVALHPIEILAGALK